MDRCRTCCQPDTAAGRSKRRMSVMAVIIAIAAFAAGGPVKVMAETNDSKIVVLQNPDDLSLLWDDLLSVEVADG